MTELDLELNSGSKAPSLSLHHIVTLAVHTDLMKQEIIPLLLLPLNYIRTQ